MQSSLLDSQPRSANDEKSEVRRALDELFSLARQYNVSADYFALMRFVGAFRDYAPYNAMLVHVQKPGATYIAPAYRWLHDYRRRVKPEARPLVILQPMGPVMFVFDVGDTEPEDGAPPLPRQILKPFEVRSGHIGGVLPQTIENAVRDGVRVTTQIAGGDSAGSIQSVKPGLHPLHFLIKTTPKPEYADVPLRYDLLLNSQHSTEAKYVTLVHELAHLYCGHLGTPNPKWWPDRQGLDEVVREFEAESVAYLICQRLGIDNPSHEYLAGYVEFCPKTPQISLECVMKSAGLIEQMGRSRLKPRGAERR
jgi:hypothetical protein